MYEIKKYKEDNINIEVSKNTFKDGSIFMSITFTDTENNNLKYEKNIIIDEGKVLSRKDYSLVEAIVDRTIFSHDRYDTFCKRGRGRTKKGVEEKMWKLHNYYKMLDFSKYEF